MTGQLEREARLHRGDRVAGLGLAALQGGHQILVMVSEAPAPAGRWQKEVPHGGDRHDGHEGHKGCRGAVHAAGCHRPPSGSPWATAARARQCPTPGQGRPMSGPASMARERGDSSGSLRGQHGAMGELAKHSGVSVPGPVPCLAAPAERHQPHDVTWLCNCKDAFIL